MGGWKESWREAEHRSRWTYLLLVFVVLVFLFMVWLVSIFVYTNPILAGVLIIITIILIPLAAFLLDLGFWEHE